MPVLPVQLPDIPGTSDEEGKNEDAAGDVTEEEGLKDAEKKKEDKEKEDKEEDDNVDDNDSGDDGSEAEIHDAAVEFGDEMENTIDDLHGVDSFLHY
jgi:hypothetical protein